MQKHAEETKRKRIVYRLQKHAQETKEETKKIQFNTMLTFTVTHAKKKSCNIDAQLLQLMSKRPNFLLRPDVYVLALRNKYSMVTILFGVEPPNDGSHRSLN